jgi:hypothetical protein
MLDVPEKTVQKWKDIVKEELQEENEIQPDNVQHMDDTIHAKEEIIEEYLE